MLRILPTFALALWFGANVASTPARAEEVPPVEVVVPLRGIIYYIQPGPQPSAQVEVGNKVTLAVKHAVESDAVVRWFRNGEEITGETGLNLELGIVDLQDSAFYEAHVSSSRARYAPLGIQLDVVTAHGTSRLLNSSLRAGISEDYPRLIGGIVLDHGPRRLVLVRAVGPSLARFGVADPLPDPELHLFDAAGNSADRYILAVTPTVVGQPTIEELVRRAAQRAGAFALPEGSNDVAYLVMFPAGAFTAHVTSRSGASGEVLLEFYDVPEEPPAP